MKSLIIQQLARGLSFFFCLLLSMGNQAVWAKQTNPVPQKHYFVQQEIYKSNGVFISRPQKTDRRILELIYQHNIRTLDDYAEWLKKNMKYKKDDTRNSWSTPLETIKKRVGDCEDFALLNAAFVRVLGFQPKFITIVREGKAHAICIFEENGYYVWFNNAQLIRTRETSLEKLAEKISVKMNYAYALELNLHTKKWNLIYGKS